MANTKLNKTQKIISIVVAVILLIVIAGGVYCVSTKQNPIDAAKSVFTSSENQIVGKWQSQKSPGLSAFFMMTELMIHISLLSTFQENMKFTAIS